MSISANYGWELPENGDGAANSKPWGTKILTVLNDIDSILAGVTKINEGLLTGYTVGTNTALDATDSIVGAFGKIQSQINDATITIGTTSVALNGSTTTLAGLTSVTSTSFTGNLTGTASLATSLAGGVAGSLPYQSAVGTTAYLAAGTANQVLISGTTPTWSSTPALDGTNFTNIPVSAITGTISASNTTTFTVTNDTSTATACYPIIVTSNTGNLPAKTCSSKLSFIPSTGILSATGFSGSGASLTALPAANLNGTIASAVLGNSSLYIGTTQIALNQGTGTITTLAGVTAEAATTATNLAAGVIGSLPYQSAAGTTALLAPNTATARKILAQAGNGTDGAAPFWHTLTSLDLATALEDACDIGTSTAATGKFTTLYASKKLNLKIAANTESPLYGDVWIDSTRQTLIVNEGHYDVDTSTSHQVAICKQGVMGIANTSTAVTLANTANYYSVLSNTIFGTLTLPINFLVIGKTVHLKIMGSLVVDTSATVINIKINIGSSTFSLAATSSLETGTYNFVLDADIMLSGTPGTTAATLGMATCIFTSSTGNTVASCVSQSTTPTVDTTVANAIDCQFNATTGTTSTVSVKCGIVSILG